MSVDAEHPSVAFPARGVRGWLIFEGVLLIALGVLAAALPLFAGLAVALVLGWILVFSGLRGLVGLFGSRGHDHPLWRLISAVIAVGAGGIVLWSPVVGVIGLAILIAAYLTLNAFTSFAMAFHHRGRAAKGWGWQVFSGLVGIVLAVFILLELGAWPVAAAWYFSLVTSFMMFFRLRLWLEHQGTDDTQRLALTWWQGAILSPHYAWHHWEHHRYPTIPYHKLAQARQRLAGPPILTLRDLVASFASAGPIPSGTALKVRAATVTPLPEERKTARAA